MGIIFVELHKIYDLENLERLEQALDDLKSYYLESTTLKKLRDDVELAKLVLVYKDAIAENPVTNIPKQLQIPHLGVS